MKMQGRMRGLMGAAILALAACDPALNWRTVQVPGAPLQALLPCDAQAATRPVALGEDTVQLGLQSCDADGATYAISHFLLKEPERAAQTLAYWQAVVREQLHAVPRGEPAPGDGSFRPRGALNLPQSLRATFAGTGPQGRQLTGQAVWFASLEPGGVRVYHAVIYADQVRVQAADTFFSGLELQ